MQNAFAKLTSIERDRINEIISIHTDFEKGKFEENLDPENWVDWFEQLSEPDYTDYYGTHVLVLQSGRNLYKRSKYGL